MSKDWDRLIELLHPDPHSILGPHLTGDGIVLRAFRPDAQSIVAAPDRRPPKPFELVHPAGIFEVSFPRAKQVFGYRLEIQLRAGRREVIRDPYSFLPTLGELDLHLAREGQHEKLYEKFGAHAREALGAGGSSPGISFAVWAPSARGVSLVGDFNGWNPAAHRMKRMADGGWLVMVELKHGHHRYA